MKKISKLFSFKSTFVLIAFALLNFDLKAQDEGIEVYTIVENMPSFKGCENELNEEAKNACTSQMIISHISNDVKYPETARDLGVEGIVYVSYIVDSQGKVGNVEVVREVEGGEVLNEEAIRVVKNLPLFNPGTQGGNAVNVKYILPVNFSLP